MKATKGIFPMPVPMIAAYNEDGSVNAIAFDPYTLGYYKVSERVGNAFKDGFQLKK